MKHKDITLEDFKQYEIKHLIYGQYGEGIYKSVFVLVDVLNHSVWFEVEKDRQSAGVMGTLSTALELYNSL